MKSFLNNNSVVFHKGLITFGFLLFAFGVHNVLGAVSYDSNTYHSTNYGASNEWDAVGGTALQAANDNDGDDSYITADTQGKAETFEFPTMTIPASSTIDSVSLYMFAKKVDVSDNGVTDSANDPQITFRVEDGADPTHVSDAGTVTVSNDGTYKLYARHMGTNPITGREWKLRDFTSGKLHYGIVRANEGADTGIEPWVTAVWVDVNYAIDATSTTDATSTATTTTDGGSTGGSGSTATTTATSTNTVPTANPQSITTAVNTVATTTLLGIDTDVPAQTLTYAIATSTSHGTTTLVGNVITYTPEVDYTGADSFSFVVSDGIATSTPATVTITVGATTTAGSETGGGSSSSGGAASTGGSGGSSSGGSNSVSSGGGYFINTNGQPLSSGEGSVSNGQVLGASTTCSGLYITKYIRSGYDNDTDSVKKLQTFLNSNLGVSIPVTGYFGPMTEKYVRELQLKHKDVMLSPWSESTPTGIVYLTTVAGINNLVCPDLHLPVPTNLIPFSKHTDTPKKVVKNH